MQIILNAAETKVRNSSARPENFVPATLELRHDCDDENGLTIGLVITGDRRDLEFEDKKIVRFKAAWCTPQEFSKWLGQLVGVAALLGLTDSGDQE